MAEENQENQTNEEPEEKDQEEVITEVLDADDKHSSEQQDSNEAESNPHEAEIEKLKAERDDMQQRLLRVQAEFDNFKKRSQKEKESERKYKSEDVVKELLPALDNFERALQVEVTDETKSFMDGVSMVYSQIKEALKTQGVEEIESVGQPFDPNIHHAVMQVEDENAESETVTEELQKGYYLKDRVIRPAMVKVNK
ncbi:molecular chaperone GrpE [Lentibacillus persicus]|uniref:Protein GrpE n=1 Tax=Lentibacillus persicus TaxID=640948 RepID=A0A1I1TAC9_9BACI|nr:nucleotide exchange factor GrpE [Lentibacillus persicus]SFD55607.1 molecular chaperone GrpE [Lentibacillus persicus]